MILSLLALSGGQAKASTDAMFQQYCAHYGKHYSTTEEYEMRKQLFQAAHSQIEAINSANDATFSADHNVFSDWTHQEYTQMLGTWPKPHEMKSANPQDFDETDLPASVNWVERGAVTPVKNQEKCGSCWAFSSTGALEGANWVATGQLVSLSEQQLVDCSTKNNGCDGGLMDYAFKYAEQNPLETEADYPYHAVDGDCHYVESKGRVRASSYQDVPENRPNQLKAALAQAPASVGIQADSRVFQFYSKGVLNSDDCGINIDHGVLAVGYGTEEG